VLLHQIERDGSAAGVDVHMDVDLWQRAGCPGRRWSGLARWIGLDRSTIAGTGEKQKRQYGNVGA
jgi:hypothetical protein